MLLPLDSAWPKNGTATKLKNNAGYKVTTVTTIVTVSTFVVFFACCLSPTGVNATSLDVDHEGNIELGEFDHERAKREIKTHEGKRLTTKLVAELGTRPRHLYSFGIGKLKNNCNSIAYNPISTKDNDFLFENFFSFIYYV